MGKEFAAHLHGIAIGLASGTAVMANFGKASFFPIAVVSLTLATVAYALEKRSDTNAE